MPGYVAARLGEGLNDHGKAVKGARILVLGVSYKPNVGDVRESPALKVMAQLLRRGAKVLFHDPFTDQVDIDGRVIEALVAQPPLLTSVDCVAVLTPHSAYDLDWVAEHSMLVFDAHNAYGSAAHANVITL